MYNLYVVGEKRASLPKIKVSSKNVIYENWKKYYADEDWSTHLVTNSHRRVQYDREKPALDQKQREAGAILQEQRSARLEAEKIAEEVVTNLKYDVMSLFDELIREFGTESFSRMPESFKQRLILDKKQKLRRILELESDET